MTEHRIALERERIKDLVREYKTKGYKVKVDPPRNELPAFLQEFNYRPDIVARSPQDNLVIEVKSRETMRDAAILSSISAEVKRQPGWDFVLVLTNPRGKEQDALPERTQSKAAIHRAFDSTESLLATGSERGVRAAVLLYSWSALEASLAWALQNAELASKAKTPLALVRDGVMAGVLSHHQGEILEDIMKKRNLIAHGDLQLDFSLSDLRTLLRLGRQLLEDV